ncbi:MAG TPA: choice-of-anchor tandem repeat GloVer-containing protein [Candidatus Acidoferrum sp.]|nr:choice-of-anchor tandem repeat GloVer-containing protein [Candidatus Acidoferrum sp.]
MISLAGLASAQTENTLFDFTETDSFWPQGGLVQDAKGNLYGATRGGGTYGVGTIFELSPPAQAGGAWTKTTIYNFLSWGGTGNIPSSGLIMGRAGALYGTTYVGGDSRCVCGVLYKLVPPTQQGGAWTQQVLYAFTSAGTDGRLPNAAVVINSQGTIYGVTQQGGAWDSGVIYQVKPGTGGTFTETVLYSFGNNQDASTPNGPLVLDSTGNLYGVTSLGGAFNQGTVYKFIPPAKAGGKGTESILFSFGGGSLSSGITPVGDIVFDTAGNLYGVTTAGGNGVGDGVVYQLQPATGAWIENVLLDFNGTTGRNPAAGLTFNPANGSLYGTTSAGNPMKAGSGIVFQLTPPAVKGGAWTETTLYDFTFFVNGALPAGRILIDSSGNLDGTTLNGGLYGCDGYCGVVYQVTP